MLLVAAIHLLLQLRNQDGPLKCCRIAVAAHTNAAVDRIMCGLLQSGQTGQAPSSKQSVWKEEGELQCFNIKVQNKGILDSEGLLLCADILRVGPLRRIDRSLLGVSLHSTTGKRSEAAQELEAMLKEATSISEQNVLKDELARVPHYAPTLVLSYSHSFAAVSP